MVITYMEETMSEESTSGVRILSGPEVKYKGYFNLTETVLRFVRTDGSMSETVTRLNLERPDASAVLLHDTADDALILVKQFRYSVFAGGDGGWMTEIVAGIIDPQDDPERAAMREVMEETGYEVDGLKHLFTFYPSPGGCSEKCFLFAAEVDEGKRTGKGGGAPGEEEDIEVLKIPVETVFEMMDKKEIIDAKTLIALQWYRACRGG